MSFSNLKEMIEYHNRKLEDINRAFEGLNRDFEEMNREFEGLNRELAIDTNESIKKLDKLHTIK